MNGLKDLSKAMADAVETAGAYTVLVTGRVRFPASGIAYDAGHILTADHVVEMDEDIRILLPDGTEARARVIGRDPGSDLALLALVEGAVTPAQTGAAARVGQFALAIGRPTPEGLQASLGVVSAISGPARTGRGGLLEQFIRTDAIPYPGFSGGPLVDVEGRVIGINTSGLGGGASVAIPVALAWQVAAALKEHGSVKRGYLGLRTQRVELPAKSKSGQSYGLLVMGLEEDSPAAAAGLMVGDILTGFNGQPVSDHDELLALLTGAVVGQAAPLEILRGGQPQTLEVTAVERPEGSHRHGYKQGHKQGRRGMRWGGRGRHG